MRRANNRVVDDGVLRIGSVALDRRNRAWSATAPP
jgi:hypothetical protein